jgi:signal transduction histidine kinase
MFSRYAEGVFTQLCRAQAAEAHSSASVLRSLNVAAEQSYPDLISLAVHELRTPASVVAGYLRMLQHDSESPLTERQRRMVDEAEKSCGKLVGLIASLSEVAKIDDGQITMARKKTDLFELVAEVANSVHEAGEREVLLEVSGQTVGAVMAGDEDRLRAAFAAVFHAILREKVGPCTVVADRRLVNGGHSSSAVIVVAESAGVQAAYDAPPGSFDEKRGGVGLSLAIARRVIEAHGGRLWSPAFVKDSGAAGPAFDERTARSTALIALPLGN